MKFPLLTAKYLNKSKICLLAHREKAMEKVKLFLREQLQRIHIPFPVPSCHERVKITAGRAPLPSAPEK